MSGLDASDERLRNKREAARYLGISVGTLEKWMRAGLLPYVKLTPAGAVRFRLSDLTSFVERRVRRAGNAA